MVEERSEPQPAKTVRDQVSDVMDVATLPVAAAAGAYVFNAKTGDALYDLLKHKNELQGLQAVKRTFNNASYGVSTAAELGKSHQKWTEVYSGKLKEMGFSNVFKRFGGLHHNQKLEVIVQSVTAIGLVIGFSALLDQLKSSKKAESDKSLSV